MARLASGVRKRKDGTLEKRFTIDGKRYSVYAATQKELAEKEQETREQIKQGTYTKNANITLDKYFIEWKAHKANTIKANTMIMYSNYYNKHISKALGKRKIKDIERREVIKLQNNLLNELAPATVNAIIKTLRIILNDAIKDEITTRNAARIKPVKEEQKATETYHRALTIQEQNDFMQALKDSYYYSFIALMLLTGIRAGEAAALTWQDIDTKKNVIHITKTTTKDDNGKLTIGTSAKTEAGTRDIPINKNIRDILHDHKNKTAVLPFITNNVFVSAYGNIIDNGTINRAIKNTLEKMERNGEHIEHFTSHAMRDTFATRYIEQGGSMQTLKTLLGHSSIKMTMDLYAHVLPDTKQEEMNRIIINI